MNSTMPKTISWMAVSHCLWLQTTLMPSAMITGRRLGSCSMPASWAAKPNRRRTYMGASMAVAVAP